MSEITANSSTAANSNRPQPTNQHGRRLMEEPTSWLDYATMFVADRCSPILVKETRQALKSRQFQWTFLLVLLAVVIWSFLGISFSMRGATEESGGMMLMGYLYILGFPLAVVIPMAAFRSLAREYEDETIQLVSITSMSARRIVLGKLGSACLQIILYLAAVTPCIVFSYVLRGISFSMIWTGCSLALTGSIGLTALALAMAGSCRNVFLRVASNLVLLVALLGTYFGWCGFVSELGIFGRQQDEFSVIANFVSILFATAAYVFVEATASLISFAAENRSTRVRVALWVLAIVFFAGFMAVGCELSGDFPLSAVSTAVSLIGTYYFVIAGTMTGSERSGISNRVRRELPKSMLGRFFTGVLMPGPGRGFLFALLSMLALNLVATFLAAFSEPLSFLPMVDRASRTFTNSWHEIIFVNVVFGSGYLSFVYLVMLFLERFAGSAKVLVGLMLGIITYVLLAIASFTMHEFLFQTIYSGNRFSEAYYLNWPAMTAEGNFGNSNLGYHLFGFAVFVGVPVFVLTAAAYLVAIRELVVATASMPVRVLEEMNAPKKPIQPKGETFEEIFQQRHNELSPESGNESSRQGNG